jgi:hypothetical protein
MLYNTVYKFADVNKLGKYGTEEITHINNINIIDPSYPSIGDNLVTNDLIENSMPCSNLNS